MDWNSVDLAIALSAAFLSSILGALSGFGAGILVMPFLVPLVGVKGVVPVMAVAMIIANVARIWVYRTHVRSVLDKVADMDGVMDVRNDVLVARQAYGV